MRAMLFSRLFWRVFVPYVALSLLATSILVGVVFDRLNEVAVGQVRARLRDSATFLRREMHQALQSKPAPDLQAKLALLAKEAEVRITLVGADGTVVGDSAADPATMGKYDEQAEIIEARRRGSGTAQRTGDSPGSEVMVYALRLGPEDKPDGYVSVSMPTDSIRQEVASIGRVVWGTVLSVNLIALIVTYFAVRQVVRPLETLTRASQAVAAGDINQAVDIDRNDEIGELATAFNAMTEQLATRIDEFRRNQHELQETTKLLQTVFGTMVEGVMAIDAEQKILFANPAARTLLDFGRADVIGRPLWEVARSTPIQETARNVLADRDQESREFPLPRTENIAALVASRLPGDPCPGAVLVLHDVTELRRLENLRREFVSNVSHELKTPLASIQAYAETLQEGAIEDPEHNREFVRGIEEQADRLHTLILDLLAIAQIESGEEAFELEPIELPEIIYQCIADHQRVADTKGVSLAIERPAENEILVSADHAGLRTILDNLVDNAIDYTPPGGTITLHWSLDGENARIDVADTGVGIPREHHARIFERFYRVDKARSRELGGTGLGLAIVKHLTTVFGGRVTVDSEPGVGTTFSVFLPQA